MKVMKIILIISAVFSNVNCYNPPVVETVEDESMIFIQGAPRSFMKSSTDSKTIELNDNTSLRFDYTKKGKFAFLAKESDSGYYTCKKLGKISGAITDIHAVQNDIPEQLLLCVNYTSKYLKKRYIAVGLFDREQWSPLKIKRIKKDDLLYYSGGQCSIQKGNTCTDYFIEKEEGRVTLKKKHISIGIAEKNKRARFSHVLHSALKRLSKEADTL